MRMDYSLFVKAQGPIWQQMTRTGNEK